MIAVLSIAPHHPHRLTRNQCLESFEMTDVEFNIAFPIQVSPWGLWDCRWGSCIGVVGSVGAWLYIAWLVWLSLPMSIGYIKCSTLSFSSIYNLPYGIGELQCGRWSIMSWVWWIYKVEERSAPRGCCLRSGSSAIRYSTSDGRHYVGNYTDLSCEAELLMVSIYLSIYIYVYLSSLYWSPTGSVGSSAVRECSSYEGASSGGNNVFRRPQAA